MDTVASLFASLLFSVVACSPPTGDVSQTAAIEPAASHSGVYRAFTRGTADSSDIGGYEIEVIDRGAESSVVFMHCEGECLGGTTWPAVISGETLTFTVNDPEPVRYEGRFENGHLILTSPDQPDLKRDLPPASR